MKENNSIKFERLTEVSENTCAELTALIKQLMSSKISSTFWLGLKKGSLEQALKDKNAQFFVLKDGERIIGTATLILMQQLATTKAFLEDVVVDEAYRGRGLGRLLMEEIIKQAKLLGVEKLKFTSKPQRIAANALYQKMGFERKETNVYEMKL